MPRFEPFAGVRYDLDRFALADVTAPPYDVLTEADRIALCARSDHNAVCIDLPAASDGGDRYLEAGARFNQWRAEGTLVTDARPTFTVYRMRYTDDFGRPAATLGVIGALDLVDPGHGDVLPHEHTTPKARSDRLDLLRATRANLSAVWGLSLASGLTSLLVCDDPPLAEWTDDDEVHHTVWTVDDPVRSEAITAVVGRAPVVIADGHHRYATCLAYRNERRAAEGATGGPAEATMCFVVELVEEQLTVRPIHRLVNGLPKDFDVRAALEENGLRARAELDPATAADGRALQAMDDEGSLVLIERDRATLLEPDPAVFAGVADLDSARLAHVLAALPEHTVTNQHGADLVAKAVDNGEAQIGILLRPATVAQIEANAHAGERMPPKTTFFHPKPKTGIVFRDLA